MTDQPKEIEVPIDWRVPDSIKSQYATNMIVQHTDHEFIVSFFETVSPILLAPLTTEQIQAIDSVRAECVARIIIARDRMPRFIQALQTNLKKAESKSNSTVEEE